MTDDQDAQDPAGGFPPALEALSAAIEQLTNSDAERLARQAAPLVDEARRALAAAHGNTDGLAAGLRVFVSALNSVAESVLSETRSLTIGTTTYVAAEVVNVGVVVGDPVVLTDSGVGTDSLEVQKSGGSMLDQLPPAHLLFTILIWLLAVGLAVVGMRYGLPADVVQADTGIASLALALTVMVRERGKRN